MMQLFSNNVDTTLAASLSDSATTATLTDGSGLQSPDFDEFELLTFLAAGNVEIVRITERTGNVITIERAQEGTVARAWVMGTRAIAAPTAGTVRAMQTAGPAAESVQIGEGAAATQSQAIAIGDRAEASQSQAIAIGQEAMASQSQAIAIGRESIASQNHTIAIGREAEAAQNEAIAIGDKAQATQSAAVAIGDRAQATQSDAVAIGYRSEATQSGAVAIGDRAVASGGDAVAVGDGAVASEYGGIALGSVESTAARTMCVGALPAVPGWDGGSASDAAWQMSGAASVILTADMDLTETDSFVIPMPSGVTFYLEEFGLLITDADTVTAQPTVQAGVTGDPDRYLAAVETTGLTDAGHRQRWSSLDSASGATTLHAEVTVAATATTLSGRFYWRGFAVTDPA
jgi:hypothetical protein